ncbi:MAG: hypothetical protein RL138_1313 [Bacteroidota bacterium]|jgi:NADP-dependent 3-hydroxy acid dehydrogenase YdfG
MELNNKTAIVTGVSKGIGLATVEALLAQGMTVIGWGRTAPANLSHAQFHFVKCDVGNFASVEAAMQSTLAIAPAGIDVLVNNAGLGYFRIFDELTIEEMTEMMQTNVMGVFFVTKVVLPHMKERKLGHIVNIASIAATNGIPEGSVYCASKHAVRGFSSSLFKEARPFNVKVTCIYPGSVKTDFFVHYPTVQVNDNFMQAEDIANGVVYCLKTPANLLPVDLELRPMLLKM